MKEIFENILSNTSDYFANSNFLSLFLICIVFLVLNLTKQEKNYLLYPFVICLALVIFNPVVYLFFVQFVEPFSYNRVFWMLLIPIMFAFCIVKVVFQMDSKITKSVIFSVFALAIISFGLGEKTTLSNAENLLKIPTETTQVATILSEHGTDDENKAAVHFDLFLYIRQYDASIDIAYSRRLYQLGYIEYESVEYTEACWLIDKMLFHFEEGYNSDTLKAALETTNTRYIVLPTLSQHMQTLLAEDWTNEIGNTTSYTIVEVI